MAEPDLSSNELDRRITQTIANAYEFRLLADMYDLDREVDFMAIIQGYDQASITHCAQELKAIGFRFYGVGSLAGLQKYQQTLDRVGAAVAVVGQGVHVFGVSGIKTIRALKRIGVTSIDSSRPAKSAAYNELLYARPFRRYGILVDGQPTGTIRKRKCLAKPLPCECPVCQRNISDILQVGRREFIRLRAVHNYYQMKWAIKE
jgi:tRNA-guanine family transglycosylase